MSDEYKFTRAVNDDDSFLLVGEKWRRKRERKKKKAGQKKVERIGQKIIQYRIKIYKKQSVKIEYKKQNRMEKICLPRMQLLSK